MSFNVAMVTPSAFSAAMNRLQLEPLSPSPYNEEDNPKFKSTLCSSATRTLSVTEFHDFSFWQR